MSNWGRDVFFVRRQDKLFRTLEGFPIPTGLKGGELHKYLEPDPHRLNSSVSFDSNFNWEWSTASPELIDIRY